MHIDNDHSTQGIDGMIDSDEEMKEKSLQWLLEMDISEPEEKLFTVSTDAYSDDGLSAYEAEVAGRPMVRGNNTSDDLDNYIDEEIVVSSEGERNDIYSSEEAELPEDSADDESSGTMAIDYSRRKNLADSTGNMNIDDGSDILGLASDDDIGEAFVSIKRVKPGTVAPIEAAVEAPITAETASHVTELEANASAVELELELSIDELNDVADEVDSAAVIDDASILGTLDDGEESGWISAVDAADDAVGTEVNFEAEDAALDSLSLDELSLEPVEVEPVGMESLEMESLEVEPLEMESLEMESLEMAPLEMAPLEMESLEVESLEMEPLEMESLEVESLEMEPLEMESLEVESLEMEPLEVESSGGMDPETLSELSPEEAPVVATSGELEGDALGYLLMQGEVEDLAATELHGELGDDTLGRVSMEGDGEDAHEAPVSCEMEDEALGWLSSGSGTEDLVEAEVDVEGPVEAEVSGETDEEASGWLSMGGDTEDLLGAETLEDVGDEVLKAPSMEEGANESLEAGMYCEGEDGIWTIDVDAQETIAMSDAPVPCLVAEPGTYTVANEDSNQQSDEVNLEAIPEAVAEDGVFSAVNEEPVQQDFDVTEEADPGSVLDYVASMPAPVDDEDFDKYLLGGEHLLDVSSDPDELVVQRTEGIESVDPSPEIEIDYHEDFHAMGGFTHNSVSAIASVISPVMEEISTRARQRMEELGFGADSIEVDVMLGSDEETIRRCYAEGFQPVSAICAELPQALRDLAKVEQEALYVRLFHGQTNENWNDLFSSDFLVSPEGNGLLEQVDVPAFLEQEDSIEDSTSASECAEEFLCDEDSGELDSDLPAADVDDVDSLFDAVISEEADAVGDFDPELSPAPDDAGEGESKESVGFGEDIFAMDFADEFSGELSSAPGSIVMDIESAFSTLSLSENNADAICGVDVDEFGRGEQLDVQDAVDSVDDAPEVADPVKGSSGMSWCIPEGIVFNYASQSGAEIFADFLDAFIEEGSVEVEKLEDAIGEWEKDPAEDTIYASISRTLHTMKGIAKGVGLQRYGTLIHNFETLLEALPRPEEGGEQAYFRIVNAWLDAVVRGIEFVQEHREDIASELPVVGADLVAGDEPEEEVSELAAQGEPVAETSDVARTDQKPTAAAARQKKRDQQLADDGAKALAAQQSVRITSEKLDHLLNLASQAQQLGVRSSQGLTRGKRASAELQGRLTSVRTHISKIADRALLNVNARGGKSSAELDALEMDQYSELQEAASILREGVEDLVDLVDVASRQNALVEALLKQQSSVISGISSSIRAARVVPVSRLMPGLRRIVRTVSTDLGKVVSFKVLNETGALDRDHYSRCQVILEHMVRNALDHGIESPEERLAVGKPTAGRITIDVHKSGGDYIIKLTDDGKGIDPEKIRESAYEKGLDVDVDALSDEEAIRLVFHKGFSTANTLSEISGRGVGMDIVMSELQQIGGDIQIQSTVGLGTSFEVRIPSNVTVNGALLVTAGESSYAIPLNGLIAVEYVAVDEFFTAVEEGGTLSLFDMQCEPAYLATLCQGVSLPDRGAWNDTVPVIIAGSDKRHMAIAIDNVEEALELVVRSLGAQFSAVPGIAGAATTADGEAIVALDLNLLVGRVVTGSMAPMAVSATEDTALLALVVDDSRTQRMVATSQLDTVGVETVTAENGLVAIDLLNAAHRLPDVVLLDVEMPVKDGIETLREIRKSTRYGHLPVIMVTSRTGAKHRALAKDAGCNAYMGKPFNFTALIKQISDLTGHDLELS